MPAAAHPAGTATGTFEFLTDTKTPIAQAGGTQFIHEVASISYTGGLTCIADANDLLIVHSDGSVSGYGTETCRSCTIGGRTGSFTAVFAFHSTPTGIEGNEIFVSGSGGLAGLRGGGPFQGGPGGNTYSYDYRFTPAGPHR
jgi:hypothetical protein